MRTTSSVRRRDRKKNHSIIFGIVVLTGLVFLGSGVNPAHAVTIAHNGIGSSPIGGILPGSEEVDVFLTGSGEEDVFVLVIYSQSPKDQDNENDILRRSKS